MKTDPWKELFKEFHERFDRLERFFKAMEELNKKWAEELAQEDEEQS